MKKQLGFLLCLLLPGWLCAQGYSPEDSLSAAIHRQLNAHREDAGLEPLERHPMLDDLAKQHSTHMKSFQFLGQIDQNNETPQQRKDFMYPDLVGQVTELVAFEYGSSYQDVADRMLHEWMRKRKRRKLLTAPKLNYIGVGTDKDLDGYFGTLTLGSLYAELVTEIPPDTVAAGSEWPLIYRYLGDAPRNLITAYVLIPYPDAKRAEKYVGILPTTLEWFDNYFRITLTCDQGPGLYSFLLGPEKDLSPGGIVVEVAE